jgi:hypothetical protein
MCLSGRNHHSFDHSDPEACNSSQGSSPVLSQATLRHDVLTDPVPNAPDRR